MGYIKGVLLVLVVLFFVTLGVKNSETVRFSYYFEIFTLDVPLYALIYVSVLVGIIIGMAIGLRGRWNLRRAKRDLEIENRELRRGTAREEPARPLFRSSPPAKNEEKKQEEGEEPVQEEGEEPVEEEPEDKKRPAGDQS